MSDEDIELNLPGMTEVARIIPGFSLSRLGLIDRIEAMRDPEQWQFTVVIEARVRDDAAGHVVAVRMSNVRGQLPEVIWGAGLVELFIDDLRSDQLENVRYRVYADGSGLSLYCYDVYSVPRREVDTSRNWKSPVVRVVDMAT